MFVCEQLATNLRCFVIQDAIWSDMSDEERADHEKLFHLRKMRSGDSERYVH